MLNNVQTLLATSPFRATPFSVDRIPASLADCGRLARDIIAGMLCGATMGLFAAMVGSSF
jgi:hypothetical protein